MRVRFGMKALLAGPLLLAGPIVAFTEFHPFRPSPRARASAREAAWHAGDDDELQRTECVVKVSALVATRGGADTLRPWRWSVGRDGRRVIDSPWRFSVRDAAPSDCCAAIRQAVTTLPPSHVHTPEERTIRVSFQQGGGWVTRTYDRQAIPIEVRRLGDLAAADDDRPPPFLNAPYAQSVR